MIEKQDYLSVNTNGVSFRIAHDAQKMFIIPEDDPDNSFLIEGIGFPCVEITTTGSMTTLQKHATFFGAGSRSSVKKADGIPCPEADTNLVTERIDDE